MSQPSPVSLDEPTLRRLVRHCMAFREPRDGVAAWQLVSTLAAYLALCGVLLWAASRGQALAVLALSLPAGGLLVRLFTIQHDCGHGSFFRARAANTTVGLALSALTFTPYGYWRRTHTLHHAGSGDLSRRGVGDVDTLTVREYRSLAPFRRLLYRAYRHPLVIHLIGPPVYFLILQRSPFGQALPAREAWRSLLALNAVLVVVYGGIAFAVGPAATALALLPVACVASWVGAWLFYIQHQFEHTSWDEAGDWTLPNAALGGSSYYVLPPVLQWFTGNVGLHHIHHLNSRIPNYRLQECLDAEPLLGRISRLTPRASLRCVGLALWDEDARRLIRFSELRAA